MPHITAQFNSSGPLIDVWLAVSAPRRRAMQAKGLVPAPALKLQFIIDTGADTSMVADQHMRSLGVEARGSREIITSTSEARATACDSYDVELSIQTFGEPPFVVPALEILGRPLFNLSIDGMLGRDVLNRVVLSIDGPRMRYRIDY